MSPVATVTIFRLGSKNFTIKVGLFTHAQIVRGTVELPEEFVV